MRPLHAAAPRARLDGDGGRGLMGVAGALLPLRCTALGNCHWLCLIGGGALLLGSLPRGAQRIPAAIGGRRASARPFIEVSAALATEPSALITALHEARRGEQPLLSHRRSQIQLSSVRRNDEDIRVIGTLGAGLREEEMDLFAHLDRGGLQAAPARHLQRAGDATAEVITIASRTREASGNSYAIAWSRIIRFPHRVAGRQRTIDRCGVRLQRPNVN